MKLLLQIILCCFMPALFVFGVVCIVFGGEKAEKAAYRWLAWVWMGCPTEKRDG